MTEITKDTLIGDVLKIKAGADEVIRRYFGDGCFTCPAITTEPIGMGAVMHGSDVNAMLAELNALRDGVSELQIESKDKERKPFFSRIFGK